MLSVTVQNRNEVIILKCGGKLVHGVETSLLCAALPYYRREILIDLSEVSAMDAAGIGALVALQAAGIYFKIEKPSQQVRELLSLTRVDSLVEICGEPSEKSRGIPAVPTACFAVGD